MSVFADTSALYALLVGSETHHQGVAEAFRELLNRGRVLLTTNYVLVETTALLQHRFGLEAVRDLDTRIVPLLQTRWVSEALHRRAMENLVRTDRRRLSLVDCTSFAVMDTEGIREALAVDDDFIAQGYTVIPGKKP